MAKLEFRYYSKLNLCWIEKEIEFDTPEEAEEYLNFCMQYDRIDWAKIDGKPVEYV